MTQTANETEKKLRVLADLAQVLNENQVVWAVGGSLLLFLKGKTDCFHDIDIMVGEEYAERVKGLLSAMGTLAPSRPNQQYRTKDFFELTIDQVEVDIIAGFAIVCGGQVYDCSLRPDQIAEYVCIKAERIPLQSLSDWRRYYELMGRPEKVKMIDR